jgi:thiamine-monophosphate kinase
MPGAEDPAGPVGEFDWIAQLLRPLASGAPEALDLLDDAAVVPARPGFDLIVSKDAMVEGVHFLHGDPPDLVARKLLRANLSDLAAKAAEPYGYFLAAAFPAAYGWEARRAFAAGLAADQAAFGLRLLGGDTVATPGPLTLSATLFGWTAAGGMVRRGGAQPGEVLLVSGTIGDGWLGLAAARGELTGLDAADLAWLADRYRLPQPRTGLLEGLRRYARAAADVSDGLIADARHIAEASGVGVRLALERLPLSAPAGRWLAAQADPAAARSALASGGDDYDVLCAAAPSDVAALTAAAAARGIALSPVGEAVASAGVEVSFAGHEVDPGAGGWRH